MTDLAKEVFSDEERREAAERARTNLLGRAIRAELALRSAVTKHLDFAIRGSISDLASFTALAEQHENACIAIVKAERHIERLESPRV